MRIHAFVILLSAVFGAACARVDAARSAHPPPVHGAAYEVEVSETLRQAVETWYGTPHSSIAGQGFDCSNFVQRVYRDAFALDLPRSSRQQAEVGEVVGRDALRPGDLVFFTKRRRGRTINHVGFYVGDGTFGHVSSSRGVMLSRLDETYWRDRYHGARRLLALGPAAPTATPADPPPPDRPVDRRRNRGW